MVATKRIGRHRTAAHWPQPSPAAGNARCPCTAVNAAKTGKRPGRFHAAGRLEWSHDPAGRSHSGRHRRQRAFGHRKGHVHGSRTADKQNTETGSACCGRCGPLRLASSRRTDHLTARSALAGHGGRGTTFSKRPNRPGICDPHRRPPGAQHRRISVRLAVTAVGRVERRGAEPAIAGRRQPGRLDRGRYAIAHNRSTGKVAAGGVPGPQSACNGRCNAALVPHRRTAGHAGHAGRNRPPVLVGRIAACRRPIPVVGQGRSNGQTGRELVAKPGAARTGQQPAPENPDENRSNVDDRAHPPECAALLPGADAG